MPLASLAIVGAGLGAAAPARAATAPVKAAPAGRVAQINLSGTLAERPHGFKISLLSMGQPKAPALSTLITRLSKMVHDKSLAGVELNLHSFSLSLTQAQELGELIHQLRIHHKRVITFASSFDTNTYLLASYGDTIIMPKSGDMFLPGVALQLMFFNGLLQKLHIQADMVQIGKYKGAEEPLTRTSASKPFADDIHRLVNSLYAQLLSTIAANRPPLTTATVKTLVDRGWFSGASARKNHLVDLLMNRGQVDPWMKRQFKSGFKLLKHYDAHVHSAPNFSSPFALFKLFSAPARHSGGNTPSIAVIYADGVIMDDSPANDQNGALVTPSRIRRETARALKNPLVKAIVLRIDSPGGSAAASDTIWHILHQANKIKPVTVSMGSEAASGGYYIACAGRTITADPGTITGSIGVVGGKVDIAGLLKKVGVHLQTFSRGKHANLFGMTSNFTPSERAFVHKLMLQTYKQFTGRVMANRGKKIANIQAVARGRVFSGQAAIKAGLVDNNGSLYDVVLAAAKKANIASHYRMQIYPRARSLAGVLRHALAVGPQMPTPLALGLAAMPIDMRKQADAMFQMVTALRQDRLLLAMPVGIILKR